MRLRWASNLEKVSLK